MADNASLARPYAKAVFDLAEESSAHVAWTSTLARLSAVSQDDDFANLVADPKMDAERLSTLLNELVGDDMPTGGGNLINLLVANGRLNALADIEQQYTALVAQSNAEINAEIITAMALSDEQKAALSSALESRLGMKVKLEETVDSTLTGGAVIKAGDLVIDGSAKGRFEKLSSALMR